MPLQRQTETAEEIRERYEVVWNGVRDGRDSDLMCVELRQPEKREGFTVARRHQPAAASERRGELFRRVAAALREAATWLDLAGIRARAGIRRYEHAAGLVDALERAGRVERRELPALARADRPMAVQWRWKR